VPSINDTFLANDFPLASLKLYNRWRKEIINVSKMEDFKYSSLHDGNYYYVLDYKSDCVESKPLKDWVEITK